MASDPTKVFLCIRWNQLKRHPTMDAFIIDRKELMSGLRTLREMMGELVDVAEELGDPGNLRKTLDGILEERGNRLFEAQPGAKRIIKLE